MTDGDRPASGLSPTPGLGPAEPLWRLVPTRHADGRGVADFMLLIPGLGGRPVVAREQVVAAIRTVCESYAGRVAFADINYTLNVLWVSVDAEPGLAGQVAQSIRARVPDALLVGGHLGALPGAVVRVERGGWWGRLRRLSRRIPGRLPQPPTEP